MQIRMTQVQDVKEKILLITRLNMRTKLSVTMHFTECILMQCLVIVESR